MQNKTGENVINSKTRPPRLFFLFNRFNSDCWCLPNKGRHSDWGVKGDTGTRNFSTFPHPPTINVLNNHAPANFRRGMKNIDNFEFFLRHPIFQILIPSVSEVQRKMKPKVRLWMGPITEGGNLWKGGGSPRTMFSPVNFRIFGIHQMSGCCQTKPRISSLILKVSPLWIQSPKLPFKAGLSIFFPSLRGRIILKLSIPPSEKVTVCEGRLFREIAGTFPCLTSSMQEIPPFPLVSPLLTCISSFSSPLPYTPTIFKTPLFPLCASSLYFCKPVQWSSSATSLTTIQAKSRRWLW